MIDYINILDDKGNELTYELVSTFFIKDYDYHYVIYKELEEDIFYLAKYNGENMSDLDTNLSEEEINLCKAIFEGTDK